MAKVYLHGFVQAFTRYLDAVPTLSNLFDQIQNAFNGQLDDSNMTPNSLSSASMADGVGLTASGQYTGDGLANRTIPLPWTPRHVRVLSHTDSAEFVAIGSGTGPYASYWTLAAGTRQSGATDWQGVVLNGFQCGSNAAPLSNKNGQTYSWVAHR